MRIVYRAKRENSFAAIFRLLQRCVPSADSLAGTATSAGMVSPRLHSALPQPVCVLQSTHPHLLFWGEGQGAYKCTRML
jgi:hypothetical protein